MMPAMTTPPGIEPTAVLTDEGPKRRLSLFDAVSIIVGIIIGAGIYEATPTIARSVGSVGAMLGVWVLGGVMSLVGAFCYAELTTAYPRDGGEYVFLTRAFGRRMGFLFAWAGFWIIRPGNIGAMAFIFARYAQQLLPLPLSDHHAILAYAAGSVILLTAVNVLGVRTGTWTQNILTVVKVVGLLAVFAVGLFLAVPHPDPTAGPRLVGYIDITDLRLAIILVLFTYGGWNEVAAVAAEVRAPRKNLPRALLLGIFAVTAIYLLGNLAFLRVLGFDGTQRSDAVAADVLREWAGAPGAVFISLLICVSCLGAVTGMIFTGSRVLYAAGAEHAPYRWLARWNPRLGTPARPLVLQGICTLALLVAFGLYSNGFERLVIFTTPLFWFFFALSGVSLLVLRWRDPDVPRPYRVALYPFMPLLFIASCLFMLHAGVTYAWDQGQREAFLWTVGLMAVGVLVSFVHKEQGPLEGQGFAVLPPEEGDRSGDKPNPLRD